jgi:hypothetical protein
LIFYAFDLVQALELAMELALELDVIGEKE